MRKTRKIVDKTSKLNGYKVPSKEIMRHRNEFYGLWRRSDDQTSAWFKRLQNSIRRCKFPTTIIELLLIDRFICGLNSIELKSIQSANKSRTVTQLMKHFSDKKNDTSYIDFKLAVDETVHQIENIALEAAVKVEPGVSLSF